MIFLLFLGIEAKIKKGKSSFLSPSKIQMTKSHQIEIGLLETRPTYYLLGRL